MLLILILILLLLKPVALALPLVLVLLGEGDLTRLLLLVVLLLVVAPAATVRLYDEVLLGLYKWVCPLLLPSSPTSTSSTTAPHRLYCVLASQSLSRGKALTAPSRLPPLGSPVKRPVIKASDV
jgi:hypothetical protein